MQPSDGLVLNDPTKSVYDFHDESDRDEEGGFTIDESPKRGKKQNTTPKPKTGKPLAFVFIVNFCTDIIFSAKKKNVMNVEENPDLPQNGIESLLKASALTTG